MTGGLCMYVCMCVCMYVCNHGNETCSMIRGLWKNTRMYVYMYVYMYVCLPVSVLHAFTWTRDTHIGVSVCTYSHAHKLYYTNVHIPSN
jgi:hypothetical protein